MSFSPGGGGGISSASDVSLNNPSNNDMMTYDSSTQKWKNISRPGIVPVLATAQSRPIVPAGSVLMIIGGTVRPAWSQAGDLWAREG